ncbi:MAG: T9SS type A sorting domain-containing protein [Candidatus Hatepunaea meridiana]|nr:T9SS type A sorting domain-containing protein [Candidatus Hatepunaea meridiana]
MSSFKNIPLSTQLLFILFILLLGSTSVFSEWSQDPYDPMIIIDVGYSVYYPRIIPSGDDGFIVAWHDGRRNEIRMQKINSEGELVWDDAGVPVRFDIGENWAGAEYGTPFMIGDMVSDGEGGAIIVWMDWTFSDYILEFGAENNEIYARHISSEGEVEWGDESGLLICSFMPEQANTRILANVEPDGEGGCLFAWHDALNPNDSLRNGFYGQRISHEGELLWGENGIRIGNSEYPAWPDMVLDNLGGYFIEIEDGNIQHLTAEGEMWEEPLADEVDGWFIGSMRIGGEGFVTIILYGEVDDVKHYAVNVLSVDRRLLWEVPGVQLPLFEGQGNRRITARYTSDQRSGSYWVMVLPRNAWGLPDVESQIGYHIDNNGNMVWERNGVDIPYDLEDRGVSVDMADQQGLYVGYMVRNENRSEARYIQKIGYHGNFLWGEEPLIVWADSSENFRFVNFTQTVDAYGNIAGITCFYHYDQDYPRLYAWIMSSEGVIGEYTDHIIAPPSAFNLLEPVNNDTLDPVDSQRFTWEEPIDPNPDDEISYVLWFKSDEDSISYDLAQTSLEVQPDSLFLELEPGAIITWWIQAISDEDTIDCLSRFSFMTYIDGVNEYDSLLPTEFSIKSIYPNPFNAEIKIIYNLKRYTEAEIKIYDSQGRHIYMKELGFQSTGQHQEVINSSDWSSGVYILEIKVDDEVRKGKTVCIK